MTDTIFPETLFKPWAGNPLKDRADVEAALKALVEPVEQYRSAGGARIRLDTHAAHFDQASADMEGYSRLLWGLAPAEVGGATWIDWTPIARGLANGCDPAHPEYWGDPFDRSQRLVELAAIGFALRLVPERLWTPLSEAEQRNVAAYLLKGHACEYSDNNWKFFRLLVSMGLRHVGVDCDRELDDEYRRELDAFYLGDGWYHDGDTRRADHYIPFAFHFYGLILAVLDGGDWTKRYRERARLIAADMARWFADDGPALCFGRSMTYRFAIAGFFGAMALAGDEEIPFGQQKGYFLRHLRWWAKHPFAARDGVMPVGYAYPSLIMSEPYNSAQSPYWALKAFLPLMLPADHPFWASDEGACPKRSAVSTQPHIGFLIANPPGDAIALSCGQHTSAENTFIRFAPEKYAKFAYSARYGFSVENDLWRFDNSVFESMIGFSDDGVHFRVRETNEEALVADNLLYARWRSFADVSVETWLYWDGEFQVRFHRIDTPRPLATIEGGFAVGRDAGEVCKQDVGRAVVATATDLSAILDIGSTVHREGRCHIAAPNTNLVSAKTLVPQLRGTVPAGVSTLAVAVLAQADASQGTRKLSRLPRAPDVEALRRRLRETGTAVTLMRGVPL
ncbi:DUF2264 domain-containing protein [Ensifer sp. ENS09]|uniref:DUF2264 domain-containing protein n=1 Tax=Ensifer sp. ENS09 TaxID=2769263 RepID=UPI00177B6CF6|nr:DUF2264 domain-containing protein [Ensifer sp. ENS09]MBD9649707.1 DUF2264 domain-containing protein [Ensifer sp. ENS09]